MKEFRELNLIKIKYVKYNILRFVLEFYQSVANPFSATSFILKTRDDPTIQKKKRAAIYRRCHFFPPC